MPTRFRHYDPNQLLMLPPSVKDWLPENHLAYFISDTIDALDLHQLYARYEGDGRRSSPYDPAMMLKVLVYGYATGVFSSRRIARKLHEDVAFRVLGAGNFPAHRTICDFRHDNLSCFRSIFVQVVRLAGAVGLLKLGTVAVDGSKVKANASRHKAMSYRRMCAEDARLTEEITQLTERAARIDAQEDAQYGEEYSGDELPAEIARRSDRRQVIREAVQRLEERQREKDHGAGRSADDEGRGGKSGGSGKRSFGEPPAKAQDNFTDPESRIMKDSRGFEQSYNTQVAVDDEAQIIIATAVTQDATDVRQLRPVLDTVRRNTGQTPQRVLADAGYASEENLRSLAARGIDGYVALGREGKSLRGVGSKPHRCEMARKLQTEDGKKQYRRRKWVVEPVFGWIKSALGFRSFSLRGLGKVTAEWDLVCLALNLRRMSKKMAWE